MTSRVQFERAIGRRERLLGGDILHVPCRLKHEFSEKLPQAKEMVAGSVTDYLVQDVHIAKRGRYGGDYRQKYRCPDKSEQSHEWDGFLA